MKLWLLAFSFIAFSVSAEDKPTPAPELCQEMFNYGQEKLIAIREKFKKKKDIDSEFSEIENLIKKYPTCLSYENLKLKDNEIVQFRKHIYGYDRSFNLDQDNCKEFNVDTTNMPKNNNQGPLSWCFAFSAVDIISYFEKKRFSAYDVALHNHLAREDVNRDKISDYTELGGKTPYSIYYSLLNTKGICLEDEVNFTNGDWEKLSEMIKNISSPGKKLTEIICENKFNEQAVFNNITQDVFLALDKLSAEKRMPALLDIQCKKRHVVNTKYHVHYLSSADKDSPEKMMEKTDEILAKGEPVSIGYSSELLSSGVNFSGAPDHSSTLIGRKFNPASGQCEYLIKNSWGESDCQITSSIRCENGNYWVPRTSLKNNLHGVFWAEPSP